MAAGRSRCTRSNLLWMAVAVAVAGAAVGAYLLATAPVADNPFFEASERRSLGDVRHGESRSDVVSRLGQPKAVARSADRLEEGGYYKPLPRYPIENEVLMYYSRHLSLKMYVYIARNGRVVHVAYART